MKKISYLPVFLIIIAIFSFAFIVSIHHVIHAQDEQGLIGEDKDKDQKDEGAGGEGEGPGQDEGEIITPPCNLPYCNSTFAWSGMATTTASQIRSGIGYISFSGTSTTGIHYGVAVDSAGNFSGVAWANPKGTSTNNIGALSFNRNETGNPPNNDVGNGTGAIAKVVGGVVRGWAKFLKPVASGVDYDGWDGWVRFDCQYQSTNVCNLTYDANTGVLHGYAWGGPQVVGWIHFAQLTLNNNIPACSISTSPNPTVNQPVTLTVNPSGGSGTYNLYTWTLPFNYISANPATTTTFTTVGSTTAQVTVRDTNGATGVCNANFTVSGPPLVIDPCIPNFTGLRGVQMTFTAPFTGGVGPFTYQWQGNVDGYTQTVYKTFYTTGNSYNAQILITDNGNGGAVTRRTCFFQVIDPPQSVCLRAENLEGGPPFVNPGERCNLISNVLNADNCIISGTESPPFAAEITATNNYSGTTQTGASDGTTARYTLTCDHGSTCLSGGSNSATCGPRPIIKEF